MQVIPIDIGNHAKFCVERQAEGSRQKRQFGGNVDRRIRIQTNPGAELRQPARGEQKAGEHLEQK